MTPAKRDKPEKKPDTVVTAQELRARKKGHVPAEQLESAEIYRGPIVTLNRDKIRFPDGSTSDFDIARHPGAAAIIPFLSDPRGDEPQLLMLRQIEERTGVPGAFIESDLVDPRYFSAANIKNRIESYLQMIDQKRQARATA